MEKKQLDELIESRRSIRHFDENRPVEIDLIKQAITAAIDAPSWKNKQTSRYHIITSPAVKEQFMQCLQPWNQAIAKTAKALVVTTFVKDIVGFNKEGIADNELGNGWGIYDLGLQNAFFLLKLTDLGLDSIVLGLRDADAIRKTLNIPDNETIVSIIALGYRTEDVAKPRRKSADDVCKFY